MSKRLSPPGLPPGTFNRKLARLLHGFPFEDDFWLIPTSYGPFKVFALPASAQSGGFFIPIQCHAEEPNFRVFWNAVGRYHGCSEISRKWNILSDTSEGALEVLNERLELLGVKVPSQLHGPAPDSCLTHNKDRFRNSSNTSNSSPNKAKALK